MGVRWHGFEDRMLNQSRQLIQRIILRAFIDGFCDCGDACGSCGVFVFAKAFLAESRPKTLRWTDGLYSQLFTCVNAHRCLRHRSVILLLFLSTLTTVSCVCSA